jgi:hypothetical protein
MIALMRLAFWFSSVAFVAILCAQPPQEAQKKGPPPPKNLQVIKREQIGPVMGGMQAALGVRCNHCHIQGDNASDENPKKLVARQMMIMLNEINAKFPDGKAHVTCYTCHRGKTMPEMAPPAAQ